MAPPLQRSKTFAGQTSAVRGPPVPAPLGSLSIGNPIEKLYLRKMMREEVYCEFLTSLSVDTGFSEDALEGSVTPLCICAWQVARAVIADTEWTSDANALRQQIEELQEKLTMCNLTSMKAISNMTATAKGDKPMDYASEVEFHEPLAYLDPLTRELVTGIILEKVKQLANGEGSPSMLKELLAAAKRGSGDGDTDDDADADPGVGGRRRKKNGTVSIPVEQRLEEEKALEEHKNCPCAMEEMEKALEESRQLEAEAAAKIAELKCEECHIEIEKLGIHCGHAGEMPAEEATMRSAELASKRLQNLAQKDDRAQLFLHAPANGVPTRVVETQTDITGEYLNELFEASARLQATCAELSERLAEDAAGGHRRVRSALQTEASLRAMQLARSVFLRLWDDALLRGRGLHQRERLPPGTKTTKTVLLARELPPRPVPAVVPVVASTKLPPHVVISNSSRSAQVGELEAKEVEEECVEELDVQGSNAVCASELEASPAPPRPKLKEAPHPKLGEGWEQRPFVQPSVQENLAALPGPKFIRHERKNASLALLAPVARTSVEAQIQHPLLGTHGIPWNPGDRLAHDSPRPLATYLPDLHRLPEPMVSCAQNPTGTEIGSVSDFLRQRRQARGADPSAQKLTPSLHKPVLLAGGGAAVAAEALYQMTTASTNQKHYHVTSVSQMDRSASLPTLMHAA